MKTMKTTRANPRAQRTAEGGPGVAETSERLRKSGDALPSWLNDDDNDAEVLNVRERRRLPGNEDYAIYPFG